MSSVCDNELYSLFSCTYILVVYDYVWTLFIVYILRMYSMSAALVCFRYWLWSCEGRGTSVCWWEFNFSESSKFFLLTYHMKIKRRWLFPWNKTLKPHKRLDESKTMHKVAEEHDVGYVTVGNWKKKWSEIGKWWSARALNEGLKERKMIKKCDALFLWFI